MALSTFVIVSNITNLSDARYCAGMGVDVLGFVMDPEHPAALSHAAFSEITGWVSGVKLMGEFFTSLPEEINRIAQENQLDFVLFPQTVSPDNTAIIKKEIILKVDVTKNTHQAEVRELLQSYQGKVSYFLMASEEAFGTDNFMMDLCKQLSSDFPLILSLKFSPENILTILESVNPAGINLKGGHEIRPGLRDFNELAEMLELLETDDF